MNEEIKDIMDALENNEFKNDGFWGRACSRLSQQLQTAKEENKQLTQQNKQMREALEEIADVYSEWDEEGIASFCSDIAQQALKGWE